MTSFLSHMYVLSCLICMFFPVSCVGSFLSHMYVLSCLMCMFFPVSGKNIHMRQERTYT
jgi:hypothetical protein